MSLALNGQNMREHQWKNRVILIISNDSNSQLYKSQIEKFNTSTKGFRERKLLVYKILPKKYKLENSQETDWNDGSALYSKYNPEDANFQVILIGLDGGIKLQQNKVLTTTKLFSRIDAMPMRQSELKG
jgi:hypothetical protein